MVVVVIIIIIIINLLLLLLNLLFLFRFYYTGRFIKNQQKYAKTNTVIYKCMEK